LPVTESDTAIDHARLRTGFRASGVVLMIALPPLVYYLWICASFYHGALQLPLSWDAARAFWSHVPGPSLTAAAILASWYLLPISLQIMAPGDWVEGTALRDGSRLRYKMNGAVAWWFTIALAMGVVATGLVPATLLAEEFGPLLTLSNLIA